jgi:hypothetical protein
VKRDPQLWAALLFVVGSSCFLIGPLPFFLDLVGARMDAITFFAGSLFFTAAATLQWVTARRARSSRADLWSAGLQLAGTIFFNVSTFRALTTTWDSPDYDKLVWRPDLFGSACFLASGYLAYVAVVGGLRGHPRRKPGGTMAAVNLFGCVAFGVSALAAYVLPGTSTATHAALANAGTAIGALAFLVGAVILFQSAAKADDALGAR